MKIIVSGASGLVGSTLVPDLEKRGHIVTRLVRPPRQPAANEARWNPADLSLDPSIVEGTDAVINLNGRSIGENRWSARVKDDLRRSRLDSTGAIATAIAGAANPPGVLINASAVGFYGNRDEELLDEESSHGEGFLANLSKDWEAAALAARSATTRVVLVRLGMVIAQGGALGKMLLPFKLGLGGPTGSGHQYWPWISMADVVEAINRALDDPEMSGPVNFVAPQQTRCEEFTRTLGKVLHRPAFMPLPGFAARLALGEMADALLLTSQRVRPRVLEETGYEFEHPELNQAHRNALV